MSADAKTPQNEPGRQIGGSTARVNWYELAGAFVLCAAGTFLRFYRLDHLSLWGDELATATNSSWTVSQIATYQRPVMLQYLILHWLLPLVGRTDWWLRFPTALCGSLSLPVMYLLARRHLDRPTAFLATFLLAANCAHLVQSQNARYYGFMSLMTLLSLWVLLELMRDFRWWLLPVFLVVHLLNLFNHVVAFLVLGAEVLCLVIVVLARVGKKERGRRKPLLFAGGGLLIAGAVGFVILWPKIRAFIPLATQKEIPEMAARNWRLFVNSTADFLGIAERWRYAAVAVFFASLAALFLKSRAMCLATVLFYVVTLVGLLAGKWIWKDLPARYVFHCQPVLLLSVSTLFVTLAQLAARRIPWSRAAIRTYAAIGVVGVAAVVWGADNVWRFYHRQPVEDWRGAARYMESHAARGDFLLIARTSTYAHDYFRWYAKNPEFHIMSLTSATDLRPSDEKTYSVLAAAGQLRAVWLFSVYDYLFRSESNVPQMLASHFERVGQFGEIPVLYRSVKKEMLQVPYIWGWDLPVAKEIQASTSPQVVRRFSTAESGDYVVVVRSTDNVVVERLSVDGVAAAASGSPAGEPRLLKQAWSAGSHTIAVGFHPAASGSRASPLLSIRAGRAYVPGGETVFRGRATPEKAPPMYLWAYALSSAQLRRGETLQQRVYWKFQDRTYLQPRYKSVLYNARDARFRMDNFLTHSKILLADDGWYVMEHLYRATIPSAAPADHYTIQFNFLPDETKIAGALPRVVRVE